MFDSEMKTFLTTAKKGSFNRAAEQLYLSPNAVKKRITQLEQQIGVTLFQRTPKGLFLTNAGQALYEDFSRLALQAETSLQRARAMQQEEERQLCIGVSTAFSDFFLTNRWYEIRQQYHQIRLSFFGNRREDTDELLRSVGKTIDLAVEIYDPLEAKRFSLCTKQISCYRFCIGIPAGEPVSGENLSFASLAGRQLCLLTQGRARYFDRVRAKLLAQYPEIQLIELAEYSIRTIASCMAQGRYVLMTENMVSLFPFYSFAFLNEDDCCPFGLFFSADAGKQEREFIHQILYAPKGS